MLAYQCADGKTHQLWTEEQTVVIEFWNVLCKQCPRALDKLSELASLHSNLSFVACALATSRDDDGEKQLVDDYTAMHSFAGMAKAFMSFDQKEAAKQKLQFTRLPHCVVVVSGKVVASGNPLEDASVLRAIDAAATISCG